MPTSTGLRLTADEVERKLNGLCRSPVELYGAITRGLAGPATLVGEKTPDHLRWWKPLTAASADLKVIAVVRDPRGVVASRIEAGWGAMVPELLAWRWRLDQTELTRASRVLGPERFLRLRYEDVVLDSEGVRNAIARWLGTKEAPGHSRSVQAQDLYLAWEHWKERASEPITSSRVKAWETVLNDNTQARVLRVCRKQMRELGYWGSKEQSSYRRRSGLSATVAVRIVRMRLSRLRERGYIENQVLGTASEGHRTSGSA